jgi:hypothetical protein
MMPKPSGYTREQLMEFLETKRIKLEYMDLSYIWAQIFLYSRSLTREMDSKNLKPDTTSWDRGGWDGIIPNVRLIEIVLSDEFRVDFLHRNDAESRQQLDARGTEASNLSFWEKVRRKFNDQTFETTSCPLEANWGRQTFLEIF